MAKNTFFYLKDFIIFTWLAVKKIEGGIKLLTFLKQAILQCLGKKSFIKYSDAGHDEYDATWYLWRHS